MKRKNANKKFGRKTRGDEPLRVCEYGQMFGKIKSNNGNNFTVICSDGLTRLGRLSNQMRRNQRLVCNMFVVVTLREFETNKNNCDIIAHGNPPLHIVILLDEKTNGKMHSDINFDESDDEFTEFEESNKTCNTIEEKLDWLDDV
jgi:translation initiation factor IF-1